MKKKNWQNTQRIHKLDKRNNTKMEKKNRILLNLLLKKKQTSAKITIAAKKQI